MSIEKLIILDGFFVEKFLNEYLMELKKYALVDSLEKSLKNTFVKKSLNNKCDEKLELMAEPNKFLFVISEKVFLKSFENFLEK